MFFLEVFDHGKFVRVVGGGSTIHSAERLAYKDSQRTYKLPGVKFSDKLPPVSILDPHTYLLYAKIVNGLYYMIRV